MKGSTRKVLLGTIIILIGVLFLLDNLGVYRFDFDDLITLGIAIILIFWGIKTLVRAGGIGSIIFGLLLLFGGGSMLEDSYEIFNINISYIWNYIWPSVLILVGIKFIFGSRSYRSNENHRREYDSSYKSKKHDKTDEDTVAFSSARVGGINWVLTDKSYSTFMGGLDLDLTTAEISDGETYLNFNITMGGIDIIIPDDINVIFKGQYLFGGYEFLSRDAGGIKGQINEEHITDSNKTVIINCDISFGGIEVTLRPRNNNFNK
ncbi:LiaF domain-containing protein [Dethiothermospora halolimnae]|uniref:LiaF domain-containing protein n=1 Tax=Dethiothermospora halolimnae TaxID=3114390 RepID=UPI003CCB75F4